MLYCIYSYVKTVLSDSLLSLLRSIKLREEEEEVIAIILDIENVKINLILWMALHTKNGFDIEMLYITYFSLSSMFIV